MKRTIIMGIYNMYQFTMKVKYALKQMRKNLKKMNMYDIMEGIWTLLLVILGIWVLLSWIEIAHKSISPNPVYSSTNLLVWLINLMNGGN